MFRKIELHVVQDILINMGSTISDKTKALYDEAWVWYYRAETTFNKAFMLFCLKWLYRTMNKLGLTEEDIYDYKCRYKKL